MDEKKLTHSVVIKTIKESIDLLKNQEIKNDVEELKKQHDIISSSVADLLNICLTLPVPARQEIAFELTRLRINDVLDNIEITIANFGKPLLEINSNRHY